MTVEAIIFDVGGVLVDCSPRYLYEAHFSDRAELDHFLAHVCNEEWNRRQDRGADVVAAVRERAAEFPHYRSKIEIFYSHFAQAVAGPIPGMPELLNELICRAVPLYGLTNWPAATFVHARNTLAHLNSFRDILISSTVGLLKPDPAIFRVALDRFRVTPQRTVFVDDHPPNVDAARAVGMVGKRFEGAADLRAFLARYMDLA